MQIDNIIRPKIDAMLFPTLRRTRSALIKSLFTISVILIAWGMYSTSAEAAPVKWHPGHYYELVGTGKYSADYMKKIYNEITQTQALRGIVVRYGWGELEKSKGVYDFSNINKLLTELAARKKRLIILIETKASVDTSNDVIVPDYTKTAAYDGGFYSFDTSRNAKGRGVKLWNSQVLERKSYLLRALGKKFNSHPYFEAIGFTETAMGQVALPASAVDTHYKNLLSLNKTLRASFPNTMTFQFTNYPRQIIGTYVNAFKTADIALGGPDVFLEDKGLNFTGTDPGLYTYYPKLSGTLPLVIQVERANYVNSRHDGTGYKPSITQLLDYARDKLDVNYIFWTRTIGYYPQVLSVLEQKSQTSTPAGGLKSACPSVYASCDN